VKVIHLPDDIPLVQNLSRHMAKSAGTQHLPIASGSVVKSENKRNAF
jgi:hypothetical protein